MFAVQMSLLSVSPRVGQHSLQEGILFGCGWGEVWNGGEGDANTSEWSLPLLWLGGLVTVLFTGTSPPLVKNALHTSLPSIH